MILGIGYLHPIHLLPFPVSSLSPKLPILLKFYPTNTTNTLPVLRTTRYTDSDTLTLVSKPNSAKAPFSSFSIQQSLKHKVMYLQSIGVDYTSLSHNPSIESASLHNIQSVVSYLQHMGLTKRGVQRIFFMCPEVMTLNPDDDLRPVFIFLLREARVAASDIPSFISSCPKLLRCRVKDQLRPTFYYLVRRLGFKDLHLLTCQNSFLLASSVEGKLIPKLEYIQTMGFSYKEAVKIVTRFPALFGYSIENNLKPKFEYLVHEMGRSVHDLKGFPQYFAFSLEKRIKPRHVFLSQRGIRLPLSTMLMTNEVDFYMLDFCNMPNCLNSN